MKQHYRTPYLVIVRHAESVRNRVKGSVLHYADEAHRAPIKGIADHLVPLTPEGEQQARQRGVELRQRFGAPEIIWHSGYRRTEQTARCMLEQYSAAERQRILLRQEFLLRERDSGYTYEMLQDEAETYFPFLPEYWKTVGGFFGRPVGGESFIQVAERVRFFFEVVLPRSGYKRIFIVTHAGLIRCIRFLLEGWDYEQARVGTESSPTQNCGYLVYVPKRRGREWILKENCTV